MSFILFFAGVLVSWFVTHFYYLKDKRQQEEKCKRYEGYLRRIEAAQGIRILKDEQDEIRDVLIIKPEGIKSEEAFGKPTLIQGNPIW